MLDKFEYYHGAALVHLMDDERCQAVRRQGLLGYVVNGKVFLFVKYTTKARSPWRFTFDQEDVDRANRMAIEHDRALIVMVCGGDGVCVLKWEEAKQLLQNGPGWIATSRKHSGMYTVWGSTEELERKLSMSRWPSLAFEQDDNKSQP